MSDKKTIYAFTYPEYKGLLKVGETRRTIKERMKANIIMPSEYKVELEIDCDVSDKEVHRELEKMGVRHVNGEWYECTKEDVLRALLRIKGFSTFKNGVTGEIPINELEALMKEGQKIAIVGPTGAGKTTIVNVVLHYMNIYVTMKNIICQ